MTNGKLLSKKDILFIVFFVASLTITFFSPLFIFNNKFIREIFFFVINNYTYPLFVGLILFYFLKLLKNKIQSIPLFNISYVFINNVLLALIWFIILPLPLIRVPPSSILLLLVSVILTYTIFKLYDDKITKLEQNITLFKISYYIVSIFLVLSIIQIIYTVTAPGFGYEFGGFEVFLTIPFSIILAVLIPIYSKKRDVIYKNANKPMQVFWLFSCILSLYIYGNILAPIPFVVYKIEKISCEQITKLDKSNDCMKNFLW